MSAEPSNTKAAFWMAGWLALMLTMMVAGREAARELDVFQVMVMRSVIGLVMLLPLIQLNGGLASVGTRRMRSHVWRNVVHYAAQYAWLFALTLIPIAQLISIEFTMPIWTAILAVSFLGERMGPLKVVSVILGLVGVTIIVRPGIGAVDPGQLIALGAAIGFGVSVILVKSLTRDDGVPTIIFWMLVIQTALGVVPGVLVWQWPSAAVMPWIVLIAFCGTFSHYCMARAMVHADATVVVPMDFLRVPLAAIVGWLVYSEAIDVYTALGAAMILCGNLLNLRNAGTARIRRA